jgi:predicted DNA-binding protein YlxM (UPF0122 family)
MEKKLDESVEQSNRQIIPLIDRQVDKIDTKRMLFMYFYEKRKQSEIARYFNCSRQSVNKALQPFRKLFENPEAIAVYRDNKAEVLDAIEMILALTLTDKRKLKKASLNNVAYTFDKVHNARRFSDSGTPSGEAKLLERIEQESDEVIVRRIIERIRETREVVIRK